MAQLRFKPGKCIQVGHLKYPLIILERANFFNVIFVDLAGFGILEFDVLDPMSSEGMKLEPNFFIISRVRAVVLILG